MKKFWGAIFILTGLISVFLASKLSVQLWDYFSLDAKVPASFMEWKVVEKDPSSFALAISYQFYDRDQTFSGFTELAKPYFLNAPSAEIAKKQFSEKSWEVFYRYSNPKMSSLQKLFPFKEGIQFLLALGVLIYFVCLKKMIERQESTSFLRKK